jgi:hypothetical protein
VSERDREFMRVQLASVGIFLPDQPEPLSPTAAPVPSPADAVDRDFVREALVRAGAPPQDLEWLVASCPSEIDALEYRAPLPEAFCAVHDGPQPTDHLGCVFCRSVDLPNPPPESPAPKGKKVP